jgi:hypothetical protein
MFKSCQNNVLTYFFKKIMKLLITTFVAWLSIYTVSFTTEIKVFNFTETELSQLEVRKVRGADNRTVYTVGSN